MTFSSPQGKQRPTTRPYAQCALQSDAAAPDRPVDLPSREPYDVTVFTSYGHVLRQVRQVMRGTLVWFKARTAMIEATAVRAEESMVAEPDKPDLTGAEVYVEAGRSITG